MAKAVYGFSTTRQLLEALDSDAPLRRICGWNEAWQVPHEATFSRAFSEFATMELPQFVHEALIRETQRERLIGHIARDSTAIEARERFPETADKASPISPSTAAAAPLKETAATATAEAGKAGESSTPSPAVPPAKKRGKKGKGAHKRYKGGKPRRAPRNGQLTFGAARFRNR